MPMALLNGCSVQVPPTLQGPAAGRTEADGSSNGSGGKDVIGISVLGHAGSELCSNGVQGPMLCLFGMEATCAGALVQGGSSAGLSAAPNVKAAALPSCQRPGAPAQ